MQKHLTAPLITILIEQNFSVRTGNENINGPKLELFQESVWNLKKNALHPFCNHTFVFCFRKNVVCVSNVSIFDIITNHVLVYTVSTLYPSLNITKVLQFSRTLRIVRSCVSRFSLSDTYITPTIISDTSQPFTHT